MSDSQFVNENGSLPTAAESTEQPVTGLDAARTMVESFEEFDELITRRIFFDGTKKARLELEHRYLLMQYQLFGSDDYCEPGVVDKKLEELRSSVMELGVDCGEVKELLRRIDAVAENMSDE
jgi:hypothetical protein